LNTILLLTAFAAAGAEEPIVVQGAALARPAGEAAYSVEILDRAALTGGASGRLENALEEAAGFQLFRRTDSRAANPTSQGATLRGIGGNASSRALVLLDGVPVADPFAGWIPWPAIRPESLAAARITTGDGAGPFGAGALTGVIELSSAGPDQRAPLTLHADYGSRDSISLYGGGAVRLGDGFAALDVGYDRGDGYFLLRPEDRGDVDIPAAYEQYGASLRLVVPVGDETELQMRGAAFGDARTRGVALVDSSNEGADASARLLSRGSLPWEAAFYVQAREYRAHFARIDDARDSAIPALDQYGVPATGLGAKVEIRPTLGAHALRIGADWRRASGATHEKFSFVSGAFTRLREAGGDSSVSGVFAEDSWQLGDALILTGGGRIDRWVLSDGRLIEREIAGPALGSTRFRQRSGWEPTARIGAAFAVTPALRLRGAAYTGFRVPTLNELYRPFRVGADAVVANAELRPERLRGAEVGVDFEPLSTARASVTLFTNRAENAISNVTLGRGPGVFPGAGFVAGNFQQRLNVDAIEARGIEAQGELSAGRWSLGVSYAFTHSRVEASGLAAALDGMRPAQVPAHQASARLAYEGAQVSGGLTLRYDGARYEDDLEAERLPAAFTVDASLRIPLREGLALRFAAENLLDEEVVAGRDADGIEDLGQPRTIWIGLGWSFRP
jgi:outer membrane receptor protein involved in Fe transport